MRKVLTLGAATLCLLAVDWFAFHDFREPHNVRNYLTLFASLLVFIHFGSEQFGRQRLISTKAGSWPERARMTVAIPATRLAWYQTVSVSLSTAST